MTLVHRLLLVAALMSAGLSATAQPVAGRDYFPVTPAQPTSDPSKIVVTKFFSYQCPHCYAFAKPFDDWMKKLPADVKAERVAVSIGHASWQASAQAFYALTAMKAVPAIDDALFRAIHEDRTRLADEAGYAAWVAGRGLDRTEFLRVYRSFGVQVQTKRADELSRRHRIPSVPVLVVDGRYMVPIADDGRFDDQLEVVNSLIERVRRAR
jgi:protein dithiol oxidoreductase (disulfide-forming)